MSIRSEDELTGMKRVARAVRETLDAMRAALEPGMTTAEVDAAGAAVVARHGAASAPNKHLGFPGVNLISLNDEAVHGIPGSRVVQPGDLVKLDVTLELDGFIADAAETVAVAPATEERRRIVACAESAFQKAARLAAPGVPVREVGRAVEAEVRRWGFHVLRELSGHGVGRAIHEEPSVPNYCEPRQRERLREGMVLTIEPIISARRASVVCDPDGWTLRTSNGSLSAHYEHTLLIRRGTPLLLTA